DLRADRNRAGIDEGVIGRFITGGIEPVGHRRDDGCDDQGGDDENVPSTAAHPVEPGLPFAGVANRGLGTTSAVFVIGALIHLGTTVQRLRPVFLNPPWRRFIAANFYAGLATNAAGNQPGTGP